MNTISSFRLKKLLKLAVLAREIGDISTTKVLYSVALQMYTADKDENKDIVHEIELSLASISKDNYNNKPILCEDQWILTKTSFVKGSQCPKYLYLDLYKSEQRTPYDKETLKRFDYGRYFEERFRQTEFPSGINVKDVVGLTSYFRSYTSYLLEREEAVTVYEATIIEEEVLVMCDVLVKSIDGMIDIYECKSSRVINEAIKNDLAIQYYICRKRFGDKLNSFNLVLSNDDDSWSITDFKDELEERVEVVAQWIEKHKTVLSESEPSIPMGEQCEKPYKCEFIQYCQMLHE